MGKILLNGTLGLSIISAVLAIPAPQQSQINNDNIPGVAVPQVDASGSVYPTNSVLGPQKNLPSATAGAGATVPSSTWEYVPNQQSDPKLGLYLDFSQAENPQPIRGGNGATDPGPRTYNYDRINSDLVARPGTDSGDVPNAKWPFGLSSARSGTGGDNPGWARQQNNEELPIATAMAGVDMRLGPNAYRELHWHSANEWAYILNGSVRITAVNQNGQTFADDLVAGDLWFFPAGVPHSIQATPEGVEFLLVFNEGDFSEDATDLVSELFLRNPKEILAKNFQTDVSDFDNIPDDELYIFTGTPDTQPLDELRQEITGPAGQLPVEQSYSYHLSAQTPLTVPGGSVRIVDPTVFPIATDFSAAIFTIEPGAMREIHWHLTSDEWNFFVSGQGRVTVFSAPQSSRTFDFSAGDVGYIPVDDAHYVENTGTTTLVYLEILQAPKYQDVSVGQWLGLTPPQIVKDTLKLPDSLIQKLPKTKPYILPGNANLTTTNFTVASYPNARSKRDTSKQAYGLTRNMRLK